MSKIIVILFLVSLSCWAHVPSLVLPLKGTPIASYFLGQSDVSRAVFSELTEPEDFFVVQFNVKHDAKTLIQLFTPFCELIPGYERFQPSALLISGDLPWKKQGETNQTFIKQLKKIAIAKVTSNYPEGKRPKFYEDFGKQTYWVGGEWRGRLEEGLYAVVIFGTQGHRGNILLAMNEKEAWTPDLYKYAGEVMPVIGKGLCDPHGFTGKIP